MFQSQFLCVNIFIPNIWRREATTLLVIFMGGLGVNFIIEHDLNVNLFMKSVFFPSFKYITYFHSHFKIIV